MKPVLNYLPLESYRARYTELLSSESGWAETAFAQKFNLNSIRGNQPTTLIQNGKVLDSINRPIWALQQVIDLLSSSVGGQVYFDDFFHPGLEALPYSGREFRSYAFCWAQSFDQFDFTRPMVSWMRPYEFMAFAIFRKVFVASPLLQDLILTASPGLTEEQIVVTGLPFSSADVASRFDTGFQPEQIDVVYSSRFDTEKRPSFFLDMVELLPQLKFAICTGHDELRGSDYTAVARANHLINKGKLTLFSGLTKPEYYSVLKSAKVQFNCGKQDWVSFTLLEALTHGCCPVYPAWRDFPYVFSQMPGRLYSPESRTDAASLLLDSVANGMTKNEKQASRNLLDYHDGTLGRIADQILADR